MRNKEQEVIYQNIIKITMIDVKRQFKEIYQSVEFGAYIKPENYFVSYIFKTNEQLKEAQQSGLIKKINKYNREQLKKNGYPIDGIKDCDFASQEECNNQYNGNWYYYYK